MSGPAKCRGPLPTSLSLVDDGVRWDLSWQTSEDARPLVVHEVLRYAKGASQEDHELDGYPNFHYLLSPEKLARPKVLLRLASTPPLRCGDQTDPEGHSLRSASSPWKAGHSSNPWHDEFDLDHGHVRYFGDHKPSTVGLPGATSGNRALIEAVQFHAGTNREERLVAPPLLLFRSATVYKGQRGVVKGHVEFCGAAIIERLDYVVQRDPDTGKSFPNVALDLAVVSGDSADGIDLRWIDDRRSASLTCEEALRYAPQGWKRWVSEGRSMIPRVRRRVLASTVKTAAEQQPEPGSPEADVLAGIYNFYDGRKHAFELLASRVAAEILRESGAT